MIHETGTKVDRMLDTTSHSPRVSRVNSHASRPLVWCQTDSNGCQFALYSSVDALVRSEPCLEIESDRWLWPGHATITSLEPRLRLTYSGFILPEIRVTRERDGAFEGLFEYSSLNSGVYRTCHGKEYHWLWTISPLAERIFTDSQGNTLMRAWSRSRRGSCDCCGPHSQFPGVETCNAGMPGMNAQIVMLTQPPITSPETLILAGIDFYLLQAESEDAA